MRIFDHIRKRLEDQKGLGEPIKPRFTLAQLEQEWSPEFERLQRNRLMMGCLRYGQIGAPGKKEWDRRKGIKKRLEQYEQTGNTECLVDIANLAMLEFVEGQHPLKHFGALDGDHSCE
jgi:hypothetical protein